jgi:hypothetical protein
VFRPNPPRWITVIAALALIAVGISATVLPIDIVDQGLSIVQGYIGTDIEVTREIGWLCLFAGDALLVIGSLLPGI